MKPFYVVFLLSSNVLWAMKLHLWIKIEFKALGDLKHLAEQQQTTLSPVLVPSQLVVFSHDVNEHVLVAAMV